MADFARRIGSPGTLIGGPVILGGRGGRNGSDGGGIVNRASRLPGSITDDDLAGVGVTTGHVRFANQKVWLDDGAYSANTLHDNTAWGRVAGTDTLFAQLGSSDDPFVAWVDASVSYTNPSANTDCTAQFVVVLYTGEDTDADGVSDTFTKYQRTTDIARLGLFASGRGTLVVINTAFVVPFVEGADWWVALQCQATDGTTRSDCIVRNQKYRIWTSAYDPDEDTNLVTDGTLS